MAADEIERAEAEAREHTRETGHPVSWTFGGTWSCEHCEAKYEEQGES